LHTNTVIFAFGDCALFATSYCAVQRTSQATLFAPKLAAFTFKGLQLVILLTAISLPMGWTSSKEYTELEWPTDILITIVWVSYAVVFFGTVMKRTDETRNIRKEYRPDGPDDGAGREYRRPNADRSVVVSGRHQ
jgi:cytochrome c oxidase cbb3-type subunit 1